MEAVRRSKAKRIRNLVSGSWTESKNVNAPAVGDMVVPMMEEISGGQSTAESCLYFFPSDVGSVCLRRRTVGME